MRLARLTTALAITLIAAPALAEDGSTIPGGSRKTPGCNGRATRIPR
ncbi:hypothetical protein [Dankookia sp. P2]